MVSTTAGPTYVVVGGGRWAAVIEKVLQGIGRTVRTMAGISRRQHQETDADFLKRISNALRTKPSDIVWLCIPPGSQTPIFVQAAIQCGLHIIVEKPWTVNRTTTEWLSELARCYQRQIGVHFQYCYLDELPKLVRAVSDRYNWTFSGEFTISRPNRLNLPASANLACHLVAIQQYHFTGVPITRITTGYSGDDARRICLARIDAPGERYKLDFTRNEQPLIQRFIDAFERAIHDATSFPLDVRFAHNIHSAILRGEMEGTIRDTQSLSSEDWIYRSPGSGTAS